MFVLDSGNSTSERVWHENVTTRGTWAIYQSCIITIGLCVWQSIHLNIPPPHEAWYKQTMRKVSFALTALIAPELVAFLAWQQYCQAKSVVNAVNEGRGIPHRPWRSLRSFVGQALWLMLAPIHFLDGKRMSRFHAKSSYRLDHEIEASLRRDRGNAEVDHGSPWTTAIGFYVACGGLVGRREYGIPKVLTTKFILHLAKNEPHLLPVLHHAQVVDKSKASGLAKTITCVQAFWFCASCIARLHDHKAISLLELNTFGHCICAFIIYIFWWHKPYDVTSHTVVDHDICRYDALLSRCEGSSGYNDYSIGERQPLRMRNGMTYVYWQGKQDIKINRPVCRVHLGCEDGFPRCKTDKIAFDTAIPGTCFRLAAPGIHTRLAGDTATPVDGEFYYLSAEKLAVWQELSFIREHCSWPETALNWGIDVETRHLMTSRSRNITTKGKIASTLVAGFSFMLYGCIHLLAWFYAFSTNIEQRLWQIAVVAVISFTPGIAAVVTLRLWADSLEIKWEKVTWDYEDKVAPLTRTLTHHAHWRALNAACMLGSNDERLWTAQQNLGLIKKSQDMKSRLRQLQAYRPILNAIVSSLVFLLKLLIGINILARSCLIIESFIALPNSPSSVYEAPRWTVYVPHI